MMRARLRWSLRSLLIVVLLVSVVFGTVGRRVYHQRRMMIALQSMAASGARRTAVEYDYQFDETGNPSVSAASFVPDFLLTALGPNVFHTIVGVDLDGAYCTLGELNELQSLPSLQRLDLEYCTVTPEFLTTLSTLTNLERLDLQETGIRDADLAALAKLDKLRILLLSGPSITDQGLEHLKGLQSLETLTIRECSVTKAGKLAIEAALPNCTVTISNLDRQPL